MFSVIRLLIVGIFLCFSIAVINKSRITCKRKGYLVTILISILLIILLAFLPFENLFLTFKSPEAAYKYFNFGKSDIELIIDGKYCDFIIGTDGNSYIQSIVPKTSDGWKVIIGADTKTILQKFTDEFSIYVYQYKNTNDYFITIYSSHGGEIQISDNYNSEFFSLKKYNNTLNETFVTYYAHIPDFDTQYRITVDGNEISLKN